MLAACMVGLGVVGATVVRKAVRFGWPRMDRTGHVYEAIAFVGVVLLESWLAYGAVRRLRAVSRADVQSTREIALPLALIIALLSLVYSAISH